MPPSPDQHAVAPPPSPPRNRPLSRGALLLAGLMMVLVVWTLWVNPTPRHRIEPQASAFRVNINQADEDKLALLPNVGRTVARYIIDYRYEHDGFVHAEQLEEVYFIGPVTRQAITPWVVIE